MISVDSATYVKWGSMQEEVSNATECFIFWAQKIQIYSCQYPVKYFPVLTIDPHKTCLY